MQIVIEIDDAEIKASVMEHWYSYLSKHTKFSSLEYIQKKLPSILDDLASAEECCPREIEEVECWKCVSCEEIHEDREEAYSCCA